MSISSFVRNILESDKAAGIALIVSTILSLLLANSFIQSSYIGFWHFNINGHTLEYWINDGLMTIFFLFVGLELKQELIAGHLSHFKKALLPISGAAGGMLVPAGIYLLFNYGTRQQSGAGIPMATDIAFALGVLSLLGKRVSTSLKVFLTALAVIDDLGAILIIALLYTATIFWLNLALALVVFVVLLILNRMKVNHIMPYILGGMVMWYFMLHSGIHATITGVLVAFTIPLNHGQQTSPANYISQFLHKPVTFFILPLFALANTCIVINGGFENTFNHPYSAGILLGLVVGKPLGIFLFSFLAVALGIGSLSNDLTWKHMLGAGVLGGIGFTISIFITALAFDDPKIINNSKLAILAASLIASLSGYFWLLFAYRKKS